MGTSSPWQHLATGAALSRRLPNDLSFLSCSVYIVMVMNKNSTLQLLVTNNFFEFKCKFDEKPWNWLLLILHPSLTRSVSSYLSHGNNFTFGDRYLKIYIASVSFPMIPQTYILSLDLGPWFFGHIFSMILWVPFGLHTPPF